MHEIRMFQLTVLLESVDPQVYLSKESRNWFIGLPMFLRLEIYYTGISNSSFELLLHNHSYHWTLAQP